MITKILLFIMTGVIGYYIGKYTYQWYRKKYNVTTEPHLWLLLLTTFAITFLPNSLLVLWYWS